MKTSEAIEQLEELKVTGDDPQIAMIAFTEKEVRPIVGEAFDVEPLFALLSRRLNARSEDIKSGYWYEHRELWGGLVRTGVKYLEKQKNRDRIREANRMLQDELGLRYFLSLDKEVRPAAKVAANLTADNAEVERVVVDSYRFDPSFETDGDTTWGELLQIASERWEDSRYDAFLEDVVFEEYREESKTLALRFDFGS